MLNGRRTPLLLIFALGYVFLFQIPLGLSSFEAENCERGFINSEEECDPFFYKAKELKRDGELNRFYFYDFESWDEDWPQFFVDTNVVFNTAYGYQRAPAIVWGGGNYLVVWEEYLSNYYSLFEENIYCARVSPDGEILDSVRIPVSTAPEDQYEPSAAYDGTNYFVVWHDTRAGNYDIYGARVTLYGEVIDPEGIPICTTAHDEVAPSIAWDGTNYLVVWYGMQAGDSTVSIYGARVTPQGEVLDTDPIFISNDTLHSNYCPDVAWDGTNYLVVWEDGGG